MATGLWHSHGATFTNMDRDLISDYIHYKMQDEIIHPVPNFNSAAIIVWEDISPQTLLGMWLRIHAGIKVNPC